MTEEAGDPLVAAEVDLRDFREMPLEFERLLASDTWVLGNPEEKVAAFHLWCKSWHQVPAGSLPDDDRLLAHLSGSGPRWKKLRNHALRGWVKCTDGRFYHPVVAEKAQKAWGAKLDRRMRTHQARVAALRKKVESATGHERELLQAALDTLSQDGPQPVTGSKGREGTGREEKGMEGKGREIEKKEKPSAAADRRGAEERAARNRPTWQAYVAAIQQRYPGRIVLRDEQANTQMAKFIKRVGLENAPTVAAFYVGLNKRRYVDCQHSIATMLACVEELYAQWTSGRVVTEAEARQADQTAARGAQAERLLAEFHEERG